MAAKKPKRKRKVEMIDGFPFKDGLYCDKPIEHWNAEADKLLMHCLVRASMVDTRGIVGAKVAERILNLAMAINPTVFRETINERNTAQENLPKVLAHMMGMK